MKCVRLGKIRERRIDRGSGRRVGRIVKENFFLLLNGYPKEIPLVEILYGTPFQQFKHEFRQ